MKKFLLFAAVFVVASSCVDNGFDLSDVNTDDVAIGSDASIFHIPLANITVKADAMSGEDGTLKSILADADQWIPTTTKELDLEHFDANKLVGELFEELNTEKDSREAFADAIVEGGYEAGVRASLPSELRGLELKEVFRDHFDALYNRTELRSEISRIIGEQVGSLNEIIPEISAEMDGFGLEDDMIDMLTGSGEVRLYGTISNYMPVSGTVSLVLSRRGDQQTEILRLDLPADFKDTTQEFSVKIDDNSLRGMAEEMQMNVSLALTSYFPRQTLGDTVLKLTLKLEKKGGVSIGNLIGSGDDDDDIYYGD